MTHKPFDLEKAMRNGGRCETVSGHPVRILCTDGLEPYPIVGYYAAEGVSYPSDWEASGKFRSGVCGGSLDLVNIPEKRTGWVILEPHHDEWRLANRIIYPTMCAAKDALPITAFYARIVQLSEWEG